MKNIILCDIDGTVANNDHRQHFLEGKKDWDGFFSELINDEPIYEIINKVNDENVSGKKIIFLTERPERYRYSSTLWLKEYFDFEINLIMRKDNDYRNKLLIKKELLDENFNVDEIDCIIDNDENLILMWSKLGIKTIKV